MRDYGARGNAGAQKARSGSAEIIQRRKPEAREFTHQITYFVLESLDALRKNGRLSRVKALVATALKIKPVMQSTQEGNICQIDQAHGINRALLRMVEHIAENTKNAESRTLAISHCNCLRRAQMLGEALKERIHPKKIIILDTAGVSSLYASDGGVIVVV